MRHAVLGTAFAVFLIGTILNINNQDESNDSDNTQVQSSIPRHSTSTPAVRYTKSQASLPPGASAAAPEPRALPSSANPDTPKICRHEGMLDIMSRVRRVCVKGKCDLDKLLTEANSLNLTEFISMMNVIDQKTVFFFKTGSVEVDQAQIDEKLEELVSQMTFMIANPDNTVAFIIAKASKKGDKMKNRQLSTQRAQTVFNLVEQALKERNQTARCDQIYRTYVGAELWDFKVEPARNAGYIKESDFERAKAFKETPYDFINQSAMVFNFPCFQEMCNYMKRNQGLSCNPNAPEEQQLPEECVERVCQ